MRSGIIFEVGNKSITTRGVRYRNGTELEVTFAVEALKSTAHRLLSGLCDYIIDEEKQIRPGQTVSWASWLLKFEASRDGVLTSFEAGDEEGTFVAGATKTLRTWLEQTNMCEAEGANFVTTPFGSLIAISAGVLIGRPVHAVRYPSMEPNSGWWIFADDYDGDLASMKPTHCFHVQKMQPKIVQFLGLSPGYCFDLRKEQRVWFEEAVAHEAP